MNLQQRAQPFRAATVILSVLAVFACWPAAASRGAIEAESGHRFGGATRLRDATASGKGVVGLSGPGQRVEFTEGRGPKGPNAENVRPI